MECRSRLIHFSLYDTKINPRDQATHFCISKYCNVRWMILVLQFLPPAARCLTKRGIPRTVAHSRDAKGKVFSRRTHLLSLCCHATQFNHSQVGNSIRISPMHSEIYTVVVIAATLGLILPVIAGPGGWRERWASVCDECFRAGTQVAYACAGCKQDTKLGA